MTRKSHKAGPSAADKIAHREEVCDKILALLADKPMTVAEIMAPLKLTDSTACRYLNYLCEMGEACRSEDRGVNNRQIWMLGREGAAPARRNRSDPFHGARVVPARQVGMWRDPLVAAIHGPARGGV